MTTRLAPELPKMANRKGTGWPAWPRLARKRTLGLGMGNPLRAAVLPGDAVEKGPEGHVHIPVVIPRIDGQQIGGIAGGALQLAQGERPAVKRAVDHGRKAVIDLPPHRLDAEPRADGGRPVRRQGPGRKGRLGTRSG